jgi:hypothetical protein
MHVMYRRCRQPPSSGGAAGAGCCCATVECEEGLAPATHWRDHHKCEKGWRPPPTGVSISQAAPTDVMSDAKATAKIMRSVLHLQSPDLEGYAADTSTSTSYDGPPDVITRPRSAGSVEQ